MITRLVAASLLFASSTILAQTLDDRPWLATDATIVIDPYQDNPVDMAKVATDPKVKAVIHRAGVGLRADTRYIERAAEARRHGLRYGLYLMGVPGDPIAQADALIAAGARVNAKFLALDIENLDPKRSMAIPDAVRFLDHVRAKTGRSAALYVNFSVYKHISQRYPTSATLKAAPLWIARFRDRHGMNDATLWPTYTLWQFSSELNCTSSGPCPYRVPGTRSDIDVNVLRGGEARLKALFD